MNRIKIIVEEYYIYSLVNRKEYNFDNMCMRSFPLTTCIEKLSSPMTLRIAPNGFAINHETSNLQLTLL